MANPESSTTVVLYRRVAIWRRLDVGPFGLLYTVLHLGGATTLPVLVALPVVLALHLLVFLLGQWSVRVRCAIGYQRVRNPLDATVALVVPAANQGKASLVDVLEWADGEFAPVGRPDRTGAGTGSGAGPAEDVGQSAVREAAPLGHDQWVVVPRRRFEFQRTVFCWNGDVDAPAWHTTDFPTALPLQAYRTARGYDNMRQVQAGFAKWGANVFDMPAPQFLDLLAEQAMAPFFVFQVACVGLWSLDEYWYYALFTLVMLVIFEATVSLTRQRSHELLRDMLRPPYVIACFRCGVWQQVSTASLLPGDVVSVTAPVSRSGLGGPPADERVVPCDMLLLRGSCIVNEAMLTGESVPQRKEPLIEATVGAAEPLQMQDDAGTGFPHRGFVLFGGTQVLQHEERAAPLGSGGGGRLFLPRAPDHGCLAVVLRTGFHTSQGRLMRTIMFATERVTANSAEAAAFIAVLMVFAVAAAWYVLAEGLKDETRNQFKLHLHCIMIVTSVVPPELPMELSLAVTNSLQALSKVLVYCTEPFRIPMAGKVDICCFDKTGTLTSDNLQLLGVVAPLTSGPPRDGADSSSSSGGDGEDLGMSSVVQQISMLDEYGPTPASMVLGACHELVLVQGQPTGDPMELAMLKGVGWTCIAPDVLGPAKLGAVGGKAVSKGLVGGAVNLRVLQRLPFSSELKRMSVVVKPSANGAAEPAWVLSKGAPEVMLPLLKDPPAHYSATYRHHMSCGHRVLTLAFKQPATVGRPRVELESNLTFAGFALLDCPLKRDSAEVIRRLQVSLHRTIMITGDGALTAADVARRVGMVDKPPARTLVLVPVPATAATNLEWRPLVAGFENDVTEGSARGAEADLRYPLEPSRIGGLAKNYALVVTGDGLTALLQHHGDPSKPRQPSAVPSPVAKALLEQLCPQVSVFSRVSPSHKELVLASLKAAGHFTLMCGDGTNDVGALKQAHVGVSILNNPELEQRVSRRLDRVAARSPATTAPAARSWFGGGGGGGGANSVRDAAKQQLADLQEGRTPAAASPPNGEPKPPQDLSNRVLAELVEQDSDPTLVRLGDASIASPFTSKRTSVDCVLAVVRQGRCTLVTTIQVFKILALNCLVSAFMLSTLYLHGVKQGDSQMTVVGLLIAALFFFASQAPPMEHLAAKRPPSQLFCLSVGVSVAGQFAVHLASLLWVLHMCQPFVRADDPLMVPDGDFHPNVLNSLVFLLSSWMQVNTFAVNYCGRPFTQPLQENTLLWRSLLASWALLLVAALDVVPLLRDWLQLVALPEDGAFRPVLFAVLFLNLAGVWGVEQVARRLA